MRKKSFSLLRQKMDTAYKTKFFLCLTLFVSKEERLKLIMKFIRSSMIHGGVVIIISWGQKEPR